jgi:hypothetical protein
MSDNTLVSEKLFCDIYRLLYFLDGVSIPNEAKVLCASIEAEILEKINKREIRKVFSAYKSAPPGPLRESLRQEYIKLAHVHKNFISSSEIPVPLCSFRS